MAVLYCVNHRGLLIKALVHKFTYHPNDELILCVIPQQLNYAGVAKQAVNVNFFAHHQNPDVTDDILFNDLHKQFSAVDFSKIEIAYNCFDVYNVAAYYFEKINQKYALVECSINGLFGVSTVKSWSQISEKSMNYLELLDNYGAVSSNGKNCIKLYLHQDTDKIINNQISNEIFNYEKSLSTLPNQYLEKLFIIYPKPWLPTWRTELLLLNSDNFNVDITKLDNSKLDIIYQFVIDYYLHENSSILIKKHPYNSFSGIIENFPHTPIMAGNFPSELLQFCDEFKVNTTITIFSTSLSGLDRISDKVVCLGLSYFRFYNLLNRLYIIFSLHEELSEYFESCLFVNMPNDQIVNFFKYALKKENKFKQYSDNSAIPEKSFFVINTNDLKDDMQEQLFNKIEYAENNSLFAFIVSDEETRNKITTCLQDKFTVLSIKIKKTPIRENILIDMNDEEILIFTNNEQVSNELKIFTMMKPLKYTGIIISAAISVELNEKLGEFAESISKHFLRYENMINNKNNRIEDMKKKVEEMYKTYKSFHSLGDMFEKF